MITKNFQLVALTGIFLLTSQSALAKTFKITNNSGLSTTCTVKIKGVLGFGHRTSNYTIANKDSLCILNKKDKGKYVSYISCENKSKKSAMTAKLAKQDTHVTIKWGYLSVKKQQVCQK